MCKAIIDNPRLAYKVGFSSGFESNSNEILQRRRYEIAEVSVRETTKIREAFHKGYYECQQLIHKVNMDKINKKVSEDYESFAGDHIVLYQWAKELQEKGFSGLEIYFN